MVNGTYTSCIINYVYPSIIGKKNLWKFPNLKLKFLKNNFKFIVYNKLIIKFIGELPLGIRHNR